MSHLTPPTSAPRPSLADLVATLEAMREAGWVTATTEPTSLDVASPTTPCAPLAASTGAH